jgi:hypothetical protein
MTAKVRIEMGRIVADENGTLTLPIESDLWHRFGVVDGAIVDKYNGMTDLQVRQKDHEDAQKLLDEKQAEWDAAEVKDGPRPLDLPPL